MYKLDFNTCISEALGESNNPWEVSSASVFLKYFCPECNYCHKNLEEFSDHALENHDKSKSLFDAKSDEKTTILSNVKCEMSDEDIQGISYYLAHCEGLFSVAFRKIVSS